MTESNAITALLEQSLANEVRQRGHVMWLDRDGRYTGFVDALKTRSPRFAVVAHRGSYLETMLALEPYGTSLDQAPLLIHVPGHNKSSIRATPLLEAYESSHITERALPTLVREAAAGRVAPAAVEAFLAGPDLTFESADRWLTQQMTQARDGLDARLSQISAQLLGEELLGEGGRVHLDLGDDEAITTLRAHLERQFGLDVEWLARFATSGDSALEKTRSALWGWVLCVEYVSDLRGEPLPWLARLRRLPQALVDQCRNLAKALRATAPERYVRGAGDIDLLLEEERRRVAAADLGNIDTFPFEVATLFHAALVALEERRFDESLGYTTTRVRGSFWLERDPQHRSEWLLLESAARLGQLMTAASTPLARAMTLGDAVDAYTRQAAPVDRAHRQLEQMRLRLLDAQLPRFAELKRALDAVRGLYRGWADRLATTFARLCEDQGFLPESSLQQRTLFDEVVEPLVRQGDKVAFFVVDALRYELATELMKELEGAGTRVELNARLAELPTLTAVGMNVLAPVATQGRLAPVIRDGAFEGFRTGEYTVSKPDHRARAMGQRVHGEAALKLDLLRVADADLAALRRSVAQARGLILVHSTELDDAGEAGFGVSTFEQSLGLIKSAVHHLQQAGVKQFVFTADHGFLLLSDEGPPRAWGTVRDPKRRHVFTAERRVEAGTHTVSLSALGYDAPGHLVFPDDTGVFRTGNPGATFVHGGNSLQERVIPVLTVTRKRERGLAEASYEVEGAGLPDAMGHRRLKVKVSLARDSQSALGFAATSELELALRVPGREDIEVFIKHVSPGDALPTGRLKAKLDVEYEVWFALQGPRDERLRVEVFHPAGLERVQPHLIEGLFAVNGTGADSRTAPAGSEGLAALTDPAVRRVFEHLDRYGTIGEAQLVAILGNARAVRQFARHFDGYLAEVPFGVRVEVTPTEKRYVKEGS